MFQGWRQDLSISADTSLLYTSFVTFLVRFQMVFHLNSSRDCHGWAMWRRNTQGSWRRKDFYPQPYSEQGCSSFACFPLDPLTKQLQLLRMLGKDSRKLHKFLWALWKKKLLKRKQQCRETLGSLWGSAFNLPSWETLISVFLDVLGAKALLHRVEKQWAIKPLQSVLIRIWGDSVKGCI